MSKIITILVAGALAAHVSAETPAQQAETFYKQGLAAEQAGDPIGAKEGYTNALKANPKHANARFSLGQLKIHSEAIAAKGREAKFGAVMIPAYQLDGATVQEALDALSMIMEKESKNEVTPNFVVEDPKGIFATQKISINLKNVPAKAVMKFLTDQTNAKVKYDEHAVVISPRG
jgi:hypothetical protein